MSEPRLERLLRIATERGPFVRVVVIDAEGSTPRGVGTEMLVFADTLDGTVGGGALEFEAVTRARNVLAHSGGHGGACVRATGGRPRGTIDGRPGGEDERPQVAPTSQRSTGCEHCLWHREVVSFPLGPALGQCCGGFVRVMLERWDRGATSGLAGRVKPAGPDPALVHWQDPCGSRERKPVLDTSAPRLVLTPLVCGLAPLPIAHRDELATLAIPPRVGREAARMLSGERPATTLTVKGRDGGSDWLIEQMADHRHCLTLYGAGHVGRAIVRVMADLPFDIAWVDTGPERFEGAAMFGATPVVAADPAGHAAIAPAGGFHLVLTYSHPLDLAICHALLSRNDFAFLGLIGSTTKRARFIRRLTGAGIPASAITRLTSPIGVPTLTGKSPAVIAIAVAAQLVETIEAMAQRRNDHQHVGTTARTS